MDVVSTKEDNNIVQLLDMGIPLSQTLLDKAEDVEEGAPVLINRKVKRVFSDSSDVMTPVKAVPTQAVKVDKTVQEVENLQ